LKHSVRGAKVLSTKVTGRADVRRSASVPSSGLTLQPPMTSVVVERHQPINKVTMMNCFMLKNNVKLLYFDALNVCSFIHVCVCALFLRY